MYLKIDNNGAEQIYTFENQSVVVIGRAPSSDIQVVTDGISRKHLEVRERDGEFFVVDFGSTNGTFQNEDRLEPNKEYPFNSFFPLKLGFHVYLYLVDEISPEQLSSAIVDSAASSVAESSAPKPLNTGSTNKIKRPDKTATGINRVKSDESLAGETKRARRQLRRKSNRDEPEETLNMKMYVAVFLLVITGIAYSQGYLDGILGTDKPVRVVKKKVVKKKPVEKKPARPVKKLLTSQELESKIALDKCLLDKEIYFCKAIEKYTQRSYIEGFTVIVDDLFLKIDNLALVFGLRNSLNISEEEKENILKAAVDVMGKRLDTRELVQNDYRGPGFDMSPINMLMIYIYLIDQNQFREGMDKYGLKKFYYVGMTKNNIKNPWLAIELDRKYINAIIDDPQLMQVIRYGLYSGISEIFEKPLRKKFTTEYKTIINSVRFFF